MYIGLHLTVVGTTAAYPPPGQALYAASTYRADRRSTNDSHSSSSCCYLLKVVSHQDNGVAVAGGIACMHPHSLSRQTDERSGIRGLVLNDTPRWRRGNRDGGTIPR